MYEADLDGGFVWRAKKHVFGLEVTMNKLKAAYTSSLRPHTLVA
jgi:hypothetical protein